MTFSRTSLLLAGALAIGCSFTAHERLAEQAVGIVVVDGIAADGEGWSLTGTKYWNSAVESDGIRITNSPLGTGVSPIWYEGKLPRNFEIRVLASIEKEGLDGGWGIEFGAQERKYGYRALIYASGRFCVDRLFDLYPEFIHCIPSQPEIETGEATNILAVRVVGNRISMSVNGTEVLLFDDDRYQPGGLALAVAGAGAGIVFKDLVVLSRE